MTQLAQARFAYYLFAEDLPELLGALNTEEAELRKYGHNALADKLLKAYGELMADLEYLSLTVSGAGTVALRESERTTRVRPDSLGDGAPRLEDSLVAEPLSELPGSVGIANEELLDQDVPWWSTNEEGSSARVGGHIFGLFYSGGFGSASAPNSGEFRQHPIFNPTIEEGAAPGVIRNPIPARRFIRDAIPEIEQAWMRGFKAAKAKFDAVVDEIYVTLAAERDAARRLAKL